MYAFFEQNIASKHFLKKGLNTEQYTLSMTTEPGGIVWENLTLLNSNMSDFKIVSGPILEIAI